jgi:hypothetical protein
MSVPRTAVRVVILLVTSVGGYGGNPAGCSASVWQEKRQRGSSAGSGTAPGTETEESAAVYAWFEWHHRHPLAGNCCWRDVRFE